MTYDVKIRLFKKERWITVFSGVHNLKSVNGKLDFIKELISNTDIDYLDIKIQRL